MKKLLLLFTICAGFAACNSKEATGSFKLEGTLKNLEDQQVYLEQLYFSEKQPEVLDTADVKNGKFVLNAVAAEQGLYRVRLQNVQGGFLFVNDAEEINFTADIKDVSLTGPTFNTKANSLLKNFLVNLNDRRENADEITGKLQSLRNTGNDSAMNAEGIKLSALNEEYSNYIKKFIDTVSNPVVAMFALGYTQGIDPKELSETVPALTTRFPNHKGIAELVKQYNDYLAKPAPAKAPEVGDMAPEITMNDENGVPFSLSSLRGKYVLVDFWASWCGPCRKENPNLVAAHEKFKNKNFTILGVSLDEDKNKWINAIKKDKLNWKQISDLKYWSSAAVGLYGFDGIPYNVLLDPTGKIIAKELREEMLHTELERLLK